MNQLLQDKVNNLDKDYIHLLHFQYYINWHNIYHSPLLMLGKLSAKLNKQPTIDHTAHISRFITDGENQIAKIFEGNYYRGMEENELTQRLKVIQARVWIETLGKVDKETAKIFEKKHLGIPYDKWAAGRAGQDFKFIEKLFKFLSKIFPKVRLFNGKPKGLYCTWLTGRFLTTQNKQYLTKLLSFHLKKKVDISNFTDDQIDMMLSEITPPDFYQANLGKKELFYEF